MPKIKRQIPGTAIKNDHSLEELLDNLINFPGWHGTRNAEWIDMVTVGENLTTGIPHFRTIEEDFFLIEITESQGLIDRPPLLSQLTRKVREINQRSIEKTGRPLLLLLFS